jgi:integrase
VKLTSTEVKNKKPADKPLKFSDGKGLYLLVEPNGNKGWRLAYRFEGKQKLLSLGVYPAVSLKAARDARDECKKLLEKCIDPSAHRKATKKGKSPDADTFEGVGREWHLKFTPTWSPGHAETILARLEQNVFPWLGERQAKEITPPELLAVLRRIEARGAIETAHRVRTICGQIFRYAIATGRAERDIAKDLIGAIPPTQARNHPSVKDPKAVTELLRAIDGYEGSLITRCALQLAPLVFVRPGELRHAEWSEINLDLQEWRIPAEKMKMKERHLVPLSLQACAVLGELKPLTGGGRYVFPSVRSLERPMSENTVNAALRRMGYEKDEMTGHGFRSIASTILHEQGWQSAVIERQLAHGERNKVKAAYNFAEHLPERRKMMQAWADYLDGLKAGGKVVSFRQAN